SGQPASETPTQDEAELVLVRSRVESIGPFTPAALADAIGLRRGGIDIALANMEATGNVLRGRFTPGVDEEEFCDRRILARIHRATISGLRREIEPISAATFIRFLTRWQHASSPWHLDRGGLLEAVEQLQGFEAAAGAWEAEILPLRVPDFTSSSLDDLSLGGEVVWGRFSRRTTIGDSAAGKATMSRNVPISLGLRDALDWLLNDPTPDREQVGAAGEILELLSSRGASFLPEITSGIRRLPSDVETGLWHLVASGLVTSDGFSTVRSMADGTRKRVQRSTRSRREPRRRAPTSRWSLLQGPPALIDAAEGNGELPNGLIGTPEKIVETRAMQLLHRYGIVFPEVLAREPMAPRWRELLRVYRRAEAKGEIRGGRFVAGFVGEQFALPEAMEALRSFRKTVPDGRLIAVSACDPLNLAGVLTPGPRVPALLGNLVVFRDGVPLASVRGGELEWHAEIDEATREEALALLHRRRSGLKLLRGAAAV
ncbi:MAG: ATP-dependent DNA helicase, partial [Chloroflexi bacterium]|nr:ATP-dependent DNA helicase [Chloroflexota bacterium]